jgi:hypothetical protein
MSVKTTGIKHGSGQHGMEWDGHGIQIPAISDLRVRRDTSILWFLRPSNSKLVKASTIGEKGGVHFGWIVKQLLCPMLDCTPMQVALGIRI